MTPPRTTLWVQVPPQLLLLMLCPQVGVAAADPAASTPGLLLLLPRLLLLFLLLWCRLLLLLLLRPAAPASGDTADAVAVSAADSAGTVAGTGTADAAAVAGPPLSLAGVDDNEPVSPLTGAAAGVVPNAVDAMASALSGDDGGQNNRPRGPHLCARRPPSAKYR